MIEKIDKFSGVYRFLSNFWMAPIVLQGKVWPSSEHFYQAMKHPGEIERENIREMETPALAKYAGKNIMYYHPTFEANKERIMYIANEQKYRQHPDLKQRLIDTYPAELIECNTWNDTYWGVCDGKGQNKLGKILMNLRAKFMKEAGLTFSEDWI